MYFLAGNMNFFTLGGFFREPSNKMTLPTARGLLLCFDEK
jgi:hypothetical protein